MCVPKFPGKREARARVVAPATHRHLPSHFLAALFNTTRNRPGPMSTGLCGVRHAPGRARAPSRNLP